MARLLHEPYADLTIVSFRTDRSIFAHEDDVSVTYEIQNTGTLPTAPTQAWVVVREGETERRFAIGGVPHLSPGERYEAGGVIAALRLLGQGAVAGASAHRLRLELALGGFPRAVHAPRRLLITDDPADGVMVRALWVSPLDFNDANATRTLYATVQNAGRDREDDLVARVYALAAVHEGVGQVPKIDLGTIHVGSLMPGEITRVSLPLTGFEPPSRRMTFRMEIEKKGRPVTRYMQGYRYAATGGTAKPEYAQVVHRVIADEAIKLLEAQGIYIPDLQNPQYRGNPSSFNSWPMVGALPTGEWWNEGYWSDSWLANDPNGAGFFGLGLSDLTLVDGAHDADGVDVAFGYTEEDTFDSHFWIVDNFDDDGLNSLGINHHSALSKLRALLYGDGTTNCTDGCPGAGQYADHHLFHGAIDHYVTGHKQAAWWFIGHAVHLIGDLSVPSHVDNENAHGVWGATYHDWMDRGNYTLWDHSDALAAGGFVDPYNPVNAGDPLRYLAYTTAQLGNAFPWAETLGTQGGGDGNRTAGGYAPNYTATMQSLFGTLYFRPLVKWHVNKDEVYDYFWSECQLVDFVGLESRKDCWDHDGHVDYDNTDGDGTNVDGDLARIGNVNYPYAIRAAAGLIYYFAVQTGQIAPRTVFVTNTNDSGAGSLRQAIIDTPAGYTIKFAQSLDGGMITLASQLLVDKDLTIDASALTNGLTISGNHDHRVFEIGTGKVASMKGLTISAGFADYGGGIRVNGTLNLADSTVSGSQATNQGGAIYNYFGVVTLHGVTLSGNIASSQGGAIWAAGATTYVENSTIHGNQAGYHAGIANENGNVTVVHSTITQNNAVGAGSVGGGLSHLYFGSATTRLENSIVASNYAVQGPDLYKNQGVFTPTGLNLVGNNNTVSAEFPQSPLVGTGAATLNPQLGPLADNGGATYTRLLLTGSPAIDAAVSTPDSPTADQRAVPRAGGSDNDLGAVELPECGNGVIRVGESCDDGNAENGDCCSASCSFESTGSACELDLNVCTLDTCNGAGSCAAGPPLVCDDANACTDDQCNAVTGCVFTNNVAPCNDGDSCTTADVCGGGVCLGGPPSPAPGPVALLEAQDDTTWVWSPALDAAGYDVVSGDLGLLRSSGGNFMTATVGCLGNDQSATTLNHAAVPAPDTGFFFLVRSQNCSGSGTYDTGSPGLVGSRDAEVDAAPIACALGDCPCWPGGPQEIAALHAGTHPVTSCGIGSGAPSPTRSYTALFSYNDAVSDEYATQVFTGYSGRPVGQNYCQSYGSCYVLVDTCPPNGCFDTLPCDPGSWSPSPDVDMPITPGQSAACIQAFEAATVISGCN